jgi:hypothetical protein
MNKNNLILLFSSGAVVVILAVLVPVVQNLQEVREHAAGFPTQAVLPTQVSSNPYFTSTNITHPPVTITLPSEGQRYQAPNDAISPTLTITSPQNGTMVRATSTVTITASATDNVGVAKVEFLVNGTTVCTLTSSPYSCSWTVPSLAGATFLLVVRAYDLTGNVASKSAVVRTR